MKIPHTVLIGALGLLAGGHGAAAGPRLAGTATAQERQAILGNIGEPQDNLLHLTELAGARQFAKLPMLCAPGLLRDPAKLAELGELLKSRQLDTGHIVERHVVGYDIEGRRATLQVTFQKNPKGSWSAVKIAEVDGGAAKPYALAENDELFRHEFAPFADRAGFQEFAAMWSKRMGQAVEANGLHRAAIDNAIAYSAAPDPSRPGLKLAFLSFAYERFEHDRSRPAHGWLMTGFSRQDYDLGGASALERKESIPEYRIGAGDVVAVELLSEDQSFPGLAVQPDGAVELPGYGRFPAAGSSVPALRRLVEEALAQKGRPAPNVKITVEREAAGRPGGPQ